MTEEPKPENNTAEAEETPASDPHAVAESTPTTPAESPSEPQEPETSPAETAPDAGETSKVSSLPKAGMITAHDIIAGAAVEIEEDDLPDDHEREFKEYKRMTLVDRILLLLGSPTVLFQTLTPASGWFTAIIVVLLSSVLTGVVSMNFTDLNGWIDDQLQTQYDQMPSWQKRQMEKMEDSQKRTQRRLQVFIVKSALFVMPWLKTFAVLGFFSGLLFLVSVVADGRRSYALCLVATAHAMLIDVLRYLSQSIVSAGTGLPITHCNFAHVVTPKDAAVLHGLLKWADPFTWAFFIYICLAACYSLKVKRPRTAIALIFGVAILGVALSVGGAMMAAKAGAMFSRG